MVWTQQFQRCSSLTRNLLNILGSVSSLADAEYFHRNNQGSVQHAMIEELETPDGEGVLPWERPDCKVSQVSLVITTRKSWEVRLF